MARATESPAKRLRIGVDVLPELRRRLRLAAAKRDLTVRQYVLQAIEERLREDLGDEGEGVRAPKPDMEAIDRQLRRSLGL